MHTRNRSDNIIAKVTYVTSSAMRLAVLDTNVNDIYKKKDKTNQTKSKLGRSSTIVKGFLLSDCTGIHTSVDNCKTPSLNDNCKSPPLEGCVCKYNNAFFENKLQNPFFKDTVCM